MEKFSQMNYVRPDAAALKLYLKQTAKQMREAESYEEMRTAYLEGQKRLDNWQTMETIASIRNTADTTDPFYEEEIRFLNEENPQVLLLIQEMEKAILDCPWRADWTREYGALYLKNMEMNQKLADESVVPEMIEEGNLTQQYSKVSATASTIFRGEECNFYALLKHMQSTNRQERKEAMMAWGDLYQRISGELDEIYDKLVQVRCRIARKLGFDSYIDFIYLQRGRYDYTARDVESFRRQVKEEVVPLCQKLRDLQAERLGVDKLYYYDEALIFPEGNAVPIGSSRELVEKARKMYHEISQETGEFFDFMVKYELFDLETRAGKRPGGYCTFLPEEKAPFIFSNFNGTSADVDVLTHEAGHAFEAYTAAKKVPLMSMVFPTSEVAEIHSMSMEHFAYPWMEWFFGEKADAYRYAHLMDALEVIPYMVCVDEYQHRVFEQPSMPHAKRRQVWKELEETYMPWRDYDGHEFLEEGGFWMQKQHIFLFPFYYIDYALAQMGAFQFYGRMKKDRAKAWEDYYRLCQAGGSRGYFDLLKLAGLDNPFQEGTVKKIVESLKEDFNG